MIDIQKPRTIAQLHAEMLAEDPGCALTLSALRRLVRTGAIRSCRVGTKYLVTRASVAEFLAGDPQETNQTATVDGIRRVDL